MAKRKKKKYDEDFYLKLLVLMVLMFSYTLQPYIPKEDSTFAHSYYDKLIELNVDVLSGTYSTDYGYYNTGKMNVKFKDGYHYYT